MSFEYGLALGSFKTSSYIRLMDWEADEAAQQLIKTGCITVVVQDNGSLHTNHAARAKLSEWEKKGLYIFFLTKYCSEMNAIENE